MHPTDLRIFVAGHRGMVGSAIERRLRSLGYAEIVTRTRAELDLTDQAQVRRFFASEHIDQVVLAAAKVGGIYANSMLPADFVYENLMIEANVIWAAHARDVDRLLFLGSSCIYPKFATQPMVEEALLTGPLEPTNEPYAVAKIAGITLCASLRTQFGRDYRAIMPTNLYGPGDNYHPTRSHVIPGLIRRFHEARETGAPEVVIWGTGEPRREFLHVDDLARASVHVMERPRSEFDEVLGGTLAHLNVGTGVDLTIRELAGLVAGAVGFEGRLEFDPTMPDGTPRKLLDVSRVTALGWNAEITLRDGLRSTVDDFMLQYAARSGAVDPLGSTP
ncbi:GDP-L-fucose synthase [Agromyces sp. 3263]|uniref:GDP-L-fucose synthase family protein n=1 Tax=Agromyces sp. 3263 TaxID=2817750 RepID=UPI0028650FBA|nr:GDP-L-fucose synthase [Agromyces sp. 3263]MDR6906565.1 GDP-L-fucose synthase [Agromyces sp. 3263]